MSLDVSLMGADKEYECECCGNKYIGSDELFTANITHNLGEMADKAGIYEALWRPEEINGLFASDISSELTEGLKRLKESPEYYKQFNAENGWGVYEHFVPFVEKYLEACLEYPDAKIEISR